MTEQIEFPQIKVVDSKFFPSHTISACKHSIYLSENAKENLEDSQVYVMHCEYEDYDDWKGVELISSNGDKQKIIPRNELYDRVELTDNSVMNFDTNHPLYTYSLKTNSLEFLQYIPMFSMCCSIPFVKELVELDDDWVFDEETGEYVLDLFNKK